MTSNRPWDLSPPQPAIRGRKATAPVLVGPLVDRSDRAANLLVIGLKAFEGQRFAGKVAWLAALV
jgi:hypothetical protein